MNAQQRKMKDPKEPRVFLTQTLDQFLTPKQNTTPPVAEHQDDDSPTAKRTTPSSYNFKSLTPPAVGTVTNKRMKLLPCSDEILLDQEYPSPPSTYSITVDYPITKNAFGQLPIFPGYSYFYTDKKFIHTYHEYLIGKIEMWKNKVLDMLDDVTTSGVGDRDKHEEIEGWVKVEVADAQKGIKEETNVCVGAMNERVMLGCLRGINDKEMFLFVYEMVFSNKFELTMVYHANDKSFDLFTKFDDDETREYAFGDPNTSN
jgi:hypothetical protein